MHSAQAGYEGQLKRRTAEIIARWEVMISIRSPARLVFKHAVAGGMATIAVSAGFVSRAFSSFALPNPLMLRRLSKQKRSETLTGQSVLHRS